MCNMIEKRNDSAIFTELGLLVDFMICYLPWISNGILLVNRDRIKNQYTYIGGKGTV